MVGHMRYFERKLHCQMQQGPVHMDSSEVGDAHGLWKAGVRWIRCKGRKDPAGGFHSGLPNKVH